MSSTSASPLRVAVVGAAGRMGQLACRLVRAAEDLELVAGIERAQDLSAELRAARAAVAIDFTVAGLGAAHGMTMLELGVRPVIGTSGVSATQNADLDRVARERGLGGLVVPNFSLGVWLMLEAVARAAAFYTSAEVVELHNLRKKDAPSGTALATAEILARVWERDSIASIPIHSVRLPGVHSNQEVLFGGPGELLCLRHETYDVECFSNGILAALRYAPSAIGVARGIGPALEHARGGSSAARIE